MAGHSKWANIKHRKEKADAKKGKVFSRVTKEIISAVKQGGVDPKSNARLRLAIQKAKMANLPSDNIERNIKKAVSADQGDFYEMTYELYGHGGVGIVIEAMTDNKNRMASDLRIATNKRGGTIATPGSVLFNFEQKGVIRLADSIDREEELFFVASEAGAEDFMETEEGFVVITSPEGLPHVKEQLEQSGASIVEAQLERLGKTEVSCSNEDREANSLLIEWLESLDDVDAVYHNMMS